MAREEQQTRETPARKWTEFAAACFGALLAAATLGIIVWDGVAGEDRPPFVSVEAHGVAAYPGGFVLRVEAFNHGDSAAADVTVEGELRRGPEVIETSEATFDYVPSRSRREGGLFFKADPRVHPVELRAKGYMDP